MIRGGYGIGNPSCEQSGVSLYWVGTFCYKPSASQKILEMYENFLKDLEGLSCDQREERSHAEVHP
jgi:hypothetical protein